MQISRFRIPWFLFILVIIFTSCKQGPVIDTNVPKDHVYGLTSIIDLSTDTTYVLLSDFILYPEEIDSISGSDNIQIIHNSDYIKILGSDSIQAMEAINIWIDNESTSLVVRKSQKTNRSFSFDPKGKRIKKVQLAGDMNAWNPNSTELSEKDGIFHINLSLNPGIYNYQIVIDGKWILDPSNDIKSDNGMGGFNSQFEISRPDPNLLPILSAVSCNEKILQIGYTNTPTSVIALLENTQIETIINQNGQIEISIPAWAKIKKRSSLRVWACNETGVGNQLFIPLEHGDVVASVDQLDRKDLHRNIMYFMLIDRFVDANEENDKPVDDPLILPKANHYGGDITGIFETLEKGYFATLGVNTLWLSPLTQNPLGAFGKYPKPFTKFSGYHGYWPVSSTEVDYRFGTRAELDDLLNLAHEVDMNVLLDYVANHVHQEHPVYKNHPDWATDLYLPDGSLNTERWDDHRLTTWFDLFLPTLDLSRVEVAEPMSDSALYWVKDVDFDGFRHDATKHVDELFWRILTKKIKKQVIEAKGKPVFQIGETYGSRELINSYISSGMLDAQFDFNVYDDAVAVFARGDVSFKRLVNSLNESLAYYGNHNLMGYISGNQDRPRFISLASGEVRFDEDTKLAGWTRDIQNSDSLAFLRLSQLTTFIMSIPGIPCLYYGDEFGSPGGNDPDNRRMMRFDKMLDTNEQATLQRAMKAIHTRGNHLAYLYGEIDFPIVFDETLVITRTYFDDIGISCFNKSMVQKTFSFEIPQHYNKINLKAVYENEFTKTGNKIEIILPPLGVEMLVSNND